MLNLIAAGVCALSSAMYILLYNTKGIPHKDRHGVMAVVLAILGLLNIAMVIK